MDQRKKITIALKKARTSIDQIITAIESDRPECFPVIQQNLAAIGLLKSANLLMLESHMTELASRWSGARSRELKEELIKLMQIAQNK